MKEPGEYPGSFIMTASITTALKRLDKGLLSVPYFFDQFLK